MQCDGCQRETPYGTPLTWPDGTHRGEFCDECRDWISKGHRSAPVVLVGKHKDPAKGGKCAWRIYRNDGTAEFYLLMKMPYPRGPSSFRAYGPAVAESDLSSAPVIERNGERFWGHGLSFSKAERAFFKLLAKEETCSR